MLKKIEKLFTQTKMTWTRVIVLSVICGIIPGLLMVPEILDRSSLQQPGISFEFWIFMALLIILNCEKPVEAGLKTFVFFLISQPLIYLVQVPFVAMRWQIFGYYPQWGMITLMTLPGGMIAWYVKKQNWLSVLILTAANAVLCYELPMMGYTTLNDFPRLLLTTLFIIAELLAFNIVFFKEKKHRTAAFALVIIMLGVGTWLQIKTVSSLHIDYSSEIRGTEPFEIISDCGGMDISVKGDNLVIAADYYTTMPIEIKDADGTIYKYEFVFSEEKTELNLIE